MPKVKVSQNEYKNRVLRGCIKNAKELQGIDVKKVSKLTGIPASTLYAKIRAPETFTVWELREVFRVLHIPEAEKERIARESF